MVCLSFVSRHLCDRFVQLIRPPTITNIICIAALGYNKGEYTPAQIADAFDNAYAPILSNLDSYRCVQIHFFLCSSSRVSAAKVRRIRHHPHGQLGLRYYGLPLYPSLIRPRRCLWRQPDAHGDGANPGSALCSHSRAGVSHIRQPRHQCLRRSKVTARRGTRPNYANVHDGLGVSE